MMANPASTHEARTDARDWLIEADGPLAGLHLRAGGELPGAITAPALLDLVRTARHRGLKLARRIEAHDDGDHVSAWVEVRPDEAGEGCRLRLSDWRSRPLPPDQPDRDMERSARIAQGIADFTARLGPAQEIITAIGHGRDTGELARNMEAGIGRHWAEFVTIDNREDRPSTDWRLLDGARVRIPGSDRNWRAHLYPLGRPTPGSAGFELALVAEEGIEPKDDGPTEAVRENPERLGREIAPALRQPVTRIIANAETIRSQLAGPLAAEYTNYAADIASAGEHLLALIDDLADLEAVDDDEFSISADRIDLGELARRAAGLLAVRAQQKGIAIAAPVAGPAVPAWGEHRRVLQILLNLLGNAIRYSRAESCVRLHARSTGGKACVIVADEGEGLSAQEQARIFDKFERLGRQGDGGSGLGLYISRKLARAMDGELRVESAKGRGARFILELPIASETTG